MLGIGRDSKTDRTFSGPPVQTTPRPAAPHAPPDAHPTALTRSASLARDIKEGALGGLIGAGTAFEGEVKFKGVLRIDGYLSGRVSSEDGTFVVGDGGRVEARIEVAVARIDGTVNGDIIATERVEMGRAAKVNGNVHTRALVVEEGAIFEGTCRMPRPEVAQGGRAEESEKGGKPAGAPRAAEGAGADMEGAWSGAVPVAYAQFMAEREEAVEP